MSEPAAGPSHDRPPVDVVVVGAGFAGLYALHKLRENDFTVRVFEAGSGVGGTWFWNRYPGARCDVESVDYSYAFSEDLQQDWAWSQRYASQPELLRYLNHVADRFHLREDIEFDTVVTSAVFNENDTMWTVTTDKGAEVRSRFVVMATGSLSTARTPDFEGVESFTGVTYHTGNWPVEGVDFTNKRVGVIGTGSSGTQAIPIIAEQAKALTVFQRTPNFSLPARNADLSEEFLTELKERYPQYRKHEREDGHGGYAGRLRPTPTQSATEVDDAERTALFEELWDRGGGSIMTAYKDFATNADANATLADFVRGKIRQIVKDPAVAERLMPTDYPIGTKRVCLDTNYYDTYNRDNVTLVDVRKTPIERITEGGIQTSEAEYPLDAIVFATGFDAMTGSFLKVDIRNASGTRMREEWSAGPRTYLGLSVHGLPNLFLVAGPGSPSVLSNMVGSIEFHVEWIADCLTYLRDNNLERIEAGLGAQNDWVDHANEVANLTLFPRAASWYMGANVPGKPRVFMPYIGGVSRYRQRASEVAEKHYEGFELS